MAAVISIATHSFNATEDLPSAFCTQTLIERKAHGRSRGSKVGIWVAIATSIMQLPPTMSSQPSTSYLDMSAYLTSWFSNANKRKGDAGSSVVSEAPSDRSVESCAHSASTAPTGYSNMGDFSDEPKPTGSEDYGYHPASASSGEMHITDSRFAAAIDGDMCLTEAEIETLFNCPTTIPNTQGTQGNQEFQDTKGSLSDVLEFDGPEMTALRRKVGRALCDRLGKEQSTNAYAQTCRIESELQRLADKFDLEIPRQKSTMAEGASGWRSQLMNFDIQLNKKKGSIWSRLRDARTLGTMTRSEHNHIKCEISSLSERINKAYETMNSDMSKRGQRAKRAIPTIKQLYQREAAMNAKERPETEEAARVSEATTTTVGTEGTEADTAAKTVPRASKASDSDAETFAAAKSSMRVMPNEV